MILDFTQIKEIITTNPQRELVRKGCQYNKTLRMHLYGEGLKDTMRREEGWESQDQFLIRKAYTKSNKDLFVRVGRPIDKVFSARGGSVYYNLPDDKDRQARMLIQDVRQGYSIRKWVEMFWKPHLLDDPFGLIFLEIQKRPDALRSRQLGKSFVYPTYKAITAIYDYLPSGSGVEYIAFKLSRTEKAQWGVDPDREVYRLVDDAQDYLIERKGEEVFIISQIPNYFGSVPAQLNSDLVSPENEAHFLSFFDDVLELATQFLHKGSIQTTHEFLHAYPKYWQYASMCLSCSGTGNNVQAEDGRCAACKGTGKSLMIRVSDVMLLDIPSQDDKVIAPDVMGYTTPPIDWYQMVDSKLKLLEDLMNFTLWGAQPKSAVRGPEVDSKGQAKTATQVMDEVKPQADRLQVVSEMAEKRHKFILDAVIRLNLSLPHYQGASVNYGRRYMIEGPDDIWKKYSDARVAGAPVSVLDDLLIEYYEAKYTSDPIALSVALKLMYVEPFVHNTLEEVKELGLSEERWKEKLYFYEWYKQTPEVELLEQKPDELRKALTRFASGEKLLPLEPQKQLAA